MAPSTWKSSIERQANQGGIVAHEENGLFRLVWKQKGGLSRSRSTSSRLAFGNKLRDIPRMPSQMVHPIVSPLRDPRYFSRKVKLVVRRFFVFCHIMRVGVSNAINSKRVSIEVVRSKWAKRGIQSGIKRPIVEKRAATFCLHNRPVHSTYPLSRA